MNKKTYQQGKTQKLWHEYCSMKIVDKYIYTQAMKTKIIIVLAFFLINLSEGYSQLNNKQKKLFRAERKLEIQNKVQKLIESKEFEFVPKTAFPMGGPSIDLTTHNSYIRFSQDLIESYMPFFGRAYSVDYSTGGGGLKFEGKPEIYTARRLENNKGYDVSAKVTLPRDSYNINMKVGKDGTSNLTITSNQRSSISYLGKIKELGKRE